jgi:hypothetical protein
MLGQLVNAQSDMLFLLSLFQLFFYLIFRPFDARRSTFFRCFALRTLPPGTRPAAAEPSRSSFSSVWYISVSSYVSCGQRDRKSGTPSIVSYRIVSYRRIQHAPVLTLVHLVSPRSITRCEIFCQHRQIISLRTRYAQDTVR